MDTTRYVVLKNRKKTELMINFCMGGQAVTLILPPRGSIIIKDEYVSESIRIQEKHKELIVRHYEGIV